jgi:uncharacterized protein YndB with AHSA1/START domain
VAQPDAVVGLLVERELHIAASCEVVFAHFTDPDLMCSWMGVSAELDPRPGGLCNVDVSDTHRARGEYLEVSPYHRVVFSWGWDDQVHGLPPGSSRVEVTLTPAGGGTLLRLRHSGLPETLRASHGEGWDHYLPRLAAVAGTGDAGPDPWAQPTEMDTTLEENR